MSSLAQACKDRSVVDLREHLTVFAFNVQTRVLMSKRFLGKNLSGDELEEAKVFKELIDESVKFSLQFHISEFVPSWLKWIDWNIPQAKRVAAKQNEFLQKIIDEHKVNKSRPTMDFMDILLEHRGGDHEVVRATLMNSHVATQEAAPSPWLRSNDSPISSWGCYVMPCVTDAHTMLAAVWMAIMAGYLESISSKDFDSSDLRKNSTHGVMGYIEARDEAKAVEAFASMRHEESFSLRL
ncbi:hypothetical protein SELMODRAFT_424897 [Selaginella moellendorffii]|uniref:Uncharacterized protein n=1 Tax=Selaginella moellendorffii TaxID=88036 RepID=D8SRC8_SELML|nr:hypothetical protein SELMODRAFT_424897 [Selaginella moellendorffii]